MILLNVLYTAFWEDEKYWHWTHDIEVLKVIIPFSGTLLTGIITFVGILFAAKTTRESLNNIKESTPPELLRLATWSKIIQESQDYQANVSTYYSNYSNRLISTYHDILIRATLEKDISDLGVIDSEVRKELLLLKPKSIKNEYPRIVWRIRYNKKLFKYIIVLAVLSIYFLISALINLQIGNMYAIIIFTALFLFVLLCIIKLFHKHNNLKMIKTLYLEMLVMPWKVFIRSLGIHCMKMLIYTMKGKILKIQKNLRSGKIGFRRIILGVNYGHRGTMGYL